MPLASTSQDTDRIGDRAEPIRWFSDGRTPSLGDFINRERSALMKDFRHEFSQCGDQISITFQASATLASPLQGLPEPMSGTEIESRVDTLSKLAQELLVGLFPYRLTDDE